MNYGSLAAGYILGHLGGQCGTTDLTWNWVHSCVKRGMGLRVYVHVAITQISREQLIESKVKSGQHRVSSKQHDQKSKKEKMWFWRRLEPRLH